MAPATVILCRLVASAKFFAHPRAADHSQDPVVAFTFATFDGKTKLHIDIVELLQGGHVGPTLILNGKLETS
jgi:hypothetical protein